MELTQFKTVEQLAAAIKTLDMVTAVPWTDYSGTSTIVGWSSSTDKIFYKKIGKLVFVWFSITGTSDDTVATFTVPFTAQSDIGTFFYCRSRNNNTWKDGGYGSLPAGGTVVSLHYDGAASAWTNSATKTIQGSFVYEAA